MAQGNIQELYPNLVLDAGTATFGKEQREKMKDKKFKKRECKTIINYLCALLNSGGGIIKIRVNNEDYNLDYHGIGSDIECEQSDLVKGSVNQHFHFEYKDGIMHIFVWPWISEINNRLPQLCTIACNTYKRQASLTKQIIPLEVTNFLTVKTKAAGNSDSADLTKKKYCLFHTFKAPQSAYCMLKRTQFQYGEILGFSESMHIEFKDFSGEKYLERIKEALPKYISAFANTDGGFLFIGVEDAKREVVGCGQFIEDPGYFEELVSRIVSKLKTVHNHTHPKHINYKLNVARVMKESKQYKFLLILYVKKFSGIVFVDDPDCWKVENGKIERMQLPEWSERMIADPETKLIVSAGSQEAQSVNSCRDTGYSRSESSMGLVHVNKELFKDYPALGNPLPQSKLLKNWDIICDTLLVGTKSTPVLYTIIRQTSDVVFRQNIECCSATRKNVMMETFSKMKPIDVDKAENRCQGDSNKYTHAEGIFWSFTDCQTFYIYSIFIENATEINKIVHSQMNNKLRDRKERKLLKDLLKKTIYKHYITWMFDEPEIMARNEFVKHMEPKIKDYCNTGCTVTILCSTHDECSDYSFLLHLFKTQKIC